MMKNDEAKFILQAYRPSGLDAHDPTFSAALLQARHDPALGEWFRREQSHDMVVAAKLREITPPAGLREKILTGARVSQKPRPAPRRMMSWVGLAAAIAVVLTLGDLWQGRRADAAQARFASFAANDTRYGDHHADQGDLVKQTLGLLARTDIKLPGSLALDLATLKRDGCRTVKFAGHDAIEICFVRNGTWYHLYVMNRGAMPRRIMGNEPAMLTVDNTAVAVWSDDQHDYAVVSPQGMDALQQLAT